MNKIFLIIFAVILLFVGTSYGVKTTKVYMTDGGDKMVIASGGTLEIASGATATIANGSLAPADITVANTQIIVGNASAVGAAVAMSGDATIANTGAVTIAADSVEPSMLAATTEALIVRTLHDTVTVAEINAGHELLPALAAGQYRIVNARAIAYGGAVGTTTTVDILGTQSAGSVKLVAYAQAGLTQSALLTAGDSNSAILADGASFDACDVNTAITVGKTGGDADTATGVDFIIEYVID